MEIITQLLLEAIQGESDAEIRYLFFADIALSEGFPGVAALFTGLAHAESIHIVNHRRALEKNGYSGEFPKGSEVKEYGETLENVRLALEGELEEYTQMYPAFKKKIKRLHGKEFIAKIALLSISWAADSEKSHHSLLATAIRGLENGKDMDNGSFYLCRVCGNVEYSTNEPTELCTVCGHDLHFYTKVEVLA
jgi:rubrerythrin